jgi:hypothetical protein
MKALVPCPAASLPSIFLARPKAKTGVRDFLTQNPKSVPVGMRD